MAERTLTIAVDFDGVIHSYEHGWQDGSIYGDWMDGAVLGLTTLMQRYAVFIHTSRKPAQVARWIERQSGYGIEPTTQMHPLLPSWWQWGKRCRFWNERGVLLVTNRKLPAQVYIDDRAMPFSDWQQVMDDLDAMFPRAAS